VWTVTAVEVGDGMGMWWRIGLQVNLKSSARRRILAA